MIGQVELTKDQEEKLKVQAIAELKEEMKYEFIQKEIEENWSINSIIYTMRAALYVKIYEELKEKKVDELTEMERVALAVYELLKKYY